MSVLLEVAGLTKNYDHFTAVDHVSFSVAAGETVGLLGQNGAGKTTTLHMILDILEPTGGTIRVFGKSFARNREEILKKMNFAASYVSLPGNLTVFEDLLFFSLLYGEANGKEKIEELIALFGLPEFRNRKAGRLSSGEQTRLNLAKAFLNDPLLLLLDEPTASLDPVIARQVRGIIQERQRALGTAILWTSHNMREMETMCDRILFLHHGRIVAEGPPEELKTLKEKPDLEEVFISLASEPWE
ncbi:MAG: ABC transporter ATP-binding protein [Armatimonadetes bacterium]|nr:ABC transporter ATP-binding protein [Armatimonadota bacterium]